MLEIYTEAYKDLLAKGKAAGAKKHNVGGGMAGGRAWRPWPTIFEPAGTFT